MAAAKKNDETTENTETAKVTIPSVDDLVKGFAGKPREELTNTIKAAKKARWDGMSNWGKAGHVAITAAPYVAVAAAAGAGGYWAAGGFSAEAEASAENVVPLKSAKK
jgi:hypothetical protein